MKNTLTTSEFSGLTKIAEATGMDCWFSIVQTNGKDYIYDREENKRLPLDCGIKLLSEGISQSIGTYGLTTGECAAVELLFNSLGITLP